MTALDLKACVKGSLLAGSGKLKFHRYQVRELDFCCRHKACRRCSWHGLFINSFCIHTFYRP